MASLRTPEEKKLIVENCIDIEMAGGSVLDYLTAEGYVTPGATWTNMQKKYLGRAADKQTDGKETGVKRKGKRPQIRPDALEQDRFEYEIAKEREQDEGVAQEEKRPVTTCCAPSTRKGVQVPDELPEEVPDVRSMFTPVVLESDIGCWHKIGDDFLMFVKGEESLCMKVSEWQELVRQFEPACREMKVF